LLTTFDGVNSSSSSLAAVFLSKQPHIILFQQCQNFVEPTVKNELENEKKKTSQQEIIDSDK